MSYQYDLAVIGTGPGGYVAAIRASQLGLKTVCIEKKDIGGVCLNWGCIPSKSLIHQAKTFSHIKDLEKMGIKVDTSRFDYSSVHKTSRSVAERLSKGVDHLLKKNNIELVTGEAKFKDPNTLLIDGDKEISAKNILIATGSQPRQIPGFDFDETSILSSKSALNLQKLPESIVILGGGAIGVEFAFILSSFGVQVTLIEMLETILPFSDKDTIAIINRAFKKKKIKVLTDTKALSCTKNDGSITLEIERKGKTSTIDAEKLLVAVGRAPNTSNLGLEAIGVKIDRGFITTGDYYRTSVDSVYAIGDVVNTPLLAHVASKEGEIAVEHMAGHQGESRVNAQEVPYAVYCEPQLAGFGMTEQSATDANIDIDTASFPFRAIGKAVATDATDGVVKIIFKKESKEILGAHIAGADATELVHQILLAKKGELLLEDIATMIHAHPTLSESIMETARAGEGWAIHI